TDVPDRAKRLRQEHAAQHHRRPADADQRQGPGGRYRGARPAAAEDRLRVPGECVVSLEHGDREREPWHDVPGRAARRARAARGPRRRQSRAGVGLSDLADLYPGQFPGGMRHRAALARALSLEPGILLMDEPFGALDEQTRMVLGEDLSVLLSRTQKTIVFVTHSLGEAVYLADRVAVFSARPGTIKEVIAIEEPHPRKPSFMTSEKFTQLRNTLFALLHEEIRKAMEQSAASDRVAGRKGGPA